MRACLDLCEAQLSKAEAAGYFAEQVRIQIDPIGRRAFRGEDIPHAEKVFSIFEPHTRWMTQGKAGVPQELGVPVCIVEDQHQFILHHEILWAGGGTDCAVPVIARAQARFPARVACSFDKGFHSPANQDLLGAMLEQCALPRKGGLSRAAAAHEGQDWFRAGMDRNYHYLLCLGICPDKIVFNMWRKGIVAESEAGTLVRMAEGQSVTNKLTKKLVDMKPIESLPQILVDMLELEKK